MKTTLIFGGAFDPPHLGHTTALEDSITAIQPEKTLVLVSANPLKEHTKFNFEKRYAMAQLAFLDLPVEVSNFEQVHGLRYTSDVLQALKQNGFSRMTFVLGTDQFINFASWKNFPAILGLCDWLVLKRRGFDQARVDAVYSQMLASNLLVNTGVRFAPTNAAEISSSKIRSFIETKQLKQTKEFLSPAVFEAALEFSDERGTQTAGAFQGGRIAGAFFERPS